MPTSRRARCRGISWWSHCICDVSGIVGQARLGEGSDRQTVMIGGIIQARNDNVPLPRVKLRGGSATKPMASTPIVKPPAKDSPFFLRHVSVSRWESFAVNTDIRRYVNERNRAINDYSQYTCRVSFLVQLPHSLLRRHLLRSHSISHRHAM